MSEEKASLETCSDKLRRIFEDYAFDQKMRLRPKPNARRLNLSQLIAMFRSKDASLYEEVFPDGVEPNNALFLDCAPNNSNKVALASWPRSGNTFLRKVT